MSLTHFLDETFNVRRLKTVSGNRKQYTSTMTIDIHVQTMGDHDDIEYYGALGATHIGYDESFLINEGDKIISGRDGKKYDVVKTNEKNYGFAINTHRELILKEAK